MPALVLLLILGIWAATDQDTPNPPTAESGPFWVFHRAAVALPLRIGHALEQSRYDMNWGLARQVSKAGNIQVWAVPSEKLICLVDHQSGHFGIGLTCSRRARALRHGVYVTLLSEHKGAQTHASRTIIGIVPAGIEAVRAYTHRIGVRIPVRHGRFWWRDSVADPPKRIELSRLNSSQHPE